MDRDKPNLLGVFYELCTIIARNDLENVYDMDETGQFFLLLPRYTLLMRFDINSCISKMFWIVTSLIRS